MNTFDAVTTLHCGDKTYQIYSLKPLEVKGHNLSRLPYSLRILLENLIRREDGMTVTSADIEALAAWKPAAEPDKEIAFMPARVLLQDFTGVPCVVDLASMRDAMARLGGDPAKINPLQPVELVIDHSVQVDAYGSNAAIQINLDMEFERNTERYQFLKWGQQALKNFKVVPPNTGICHQVNLEYLARGVFVNDEGVAYPDTLVGTDSHTTMINGLGVLGWGVGGIEAEAAMLGQPVSMLIPQVVGFKLSGKLPEGSTATDLVLTVTEMLRKHGVVGKFVEFFGPGLANLPLADRATIANMAPEYGATCGIFPVDAETIRYMRFTGRSEEQVALVEAYMKAQGLFHDETTPEAEYTSILTLDLSSIEPSVAGPKRPQDRFPLSEAGRSFRMNFEPVIGPAPSGGGSSAVLERAKTDELTHGSIVIAAITSCTNTSNPYVMVAAGLVARKAVARGLKPKPWVKTSLAPGSKVVTDYLEKSGLQSDLDAIGFNTVGYGCTTCIGNSGPLPEEISREIIEKDLVAVSVLSGNRNFEGRVNQEVKANYLMSPPLVVAYALAGSIEVDLLRDPIADDKDGNPVYLRDLWPTQKEVSDTVEQSLGREMFVKSYADVYKGDDKWAAMPVPSGDRFAWDGASTYVKEAPYFENMSPEPADTVVDPTGLQCLAILGDSITTDHISPAGSIKTNSPAGQYLTEHGVSLHLFNSYGSRRGNHEVMVRGTFANVRLRNKLAPGTEGGFTTYLPTGEVTSIYDASMEYQKGGAGLVILAGKEYGSGSSRDWAAKGPALLGVKVVIAESFERIHRSNLVGMGILPLQFLPGQNVESLGLTGREEFAVWGISEGIATGFSGGREVVVRATTGDGVVTEFKALARIDTPQECQYYRHGGILQYVLRQLLKA
ncbi:MAG: aconitate hydratase AcnA [Fimbriimonadaceae bacterium]|nr:aconitate hydratase AcnA [Fimbriimonadaceae bacterium]